MNRSFRLDGWQIFLFVSLGFALFVSFSPVLFPPNDWEDYSITFNGARLLYEGYVPYRDFGISTGIGNFLLPYLSFLMFGPSYNTLYGLQVFESIALVILMYKILQVFIAGKEKFRFIVSVSILLFSLSVLSKIKIAFYNSEFLIYQLSSIYFLLKSLDKEKPYIHVTLAALFTFLCLQVKQDFGGLCFLINSCVLGYNYILDKNWKRPLIFFSVFIVLIGLFLLWVDWPSFSYWFNMGQSHQPRRHILTKIVEGLNNSFPVKSLLFLTAVFLLVFLFDTEGKCRSFKSGDYTVLIIVAGLGVQNIITLSSSNFPSLMYALPFLLGLILSRWVNVQRTFFTGVVTLFVMINYFWVLRTDIVSPIYSFYGENGLVKALKSLRGREYESDLGQSVFKAHGISKTYTANKGDYLKCNHLLDSLYKVKNRPLVLANFTVLPFECEVPTQRIRGLPLWPDNDVLLFEREKKRYLDLLDKKEFDLIFNMNLNFSGYTFTNKEFVRGAEKNYQEVLSFKLVKYKGERSISVYIPK